MYFQFYSLPVECVTRWQSCRLMPRIVRNTWTDLSYSSFCQNQSKLQSSAGGGKMSQHILTISVSNKRRRDGEGDSVDVRGHKCQPPPPPPNAFLQRDGVLQAEVTRPPQLSHTESDRGAIITAINSHLQTEQWASAHVLIVLHYRRPKEKQDAKKKNLFTATYWDLKLWRYRNGWNVSN